MCRCPIPAQIPQYVVVFLLLGCVVWQWPALGGRYTMAVPRGGHCRRRGPPVVDGAQPRGPAQGERGAVRHQQCAFVEQHDCSHLQCGEQFKFRIVYVQVPSHSKSRLWWPLMRQPRAMPPSTSMRRHMPHCRIAMSCRCCGLGAYDI